MCCNEKWKDVDARLWVFCGCYHACMIILAIAASSWIVNLNNSERWVKQFEGFTADPFKPVLKSWDAKPFVDVRLISTENGNFCPESHPEDIIHEVWLGTRGLCDCLEREEIDGFTSREYILDTMC